MKKWSQAIAPSVISLAAFAAAFIFNNFSIALGLIAVALLVAFVQPSVIGAIRPRASTTDVDSAKVKAYRQEHPNSTIMDAVYATDRP